MSTTGIKIIGCGHYLPDTIITNEMLSHIVDTDDEWITQRVGINKRHAAIHDTTHSMGAKAAEMAMENAGVTASDVDLILATTVTGDYVTPSLACLVANDIGVANAACFDISCACAGFVYALDLARRYLLDDEYKTVLIVSSEMLTKITDYTDRSTCVLFGDGAGACLLQKSDKLFTSALGSDPSGVSKLFARGISRGNPFRETPFDPLSDGFPQSKNHFLYQDGREVYKFATKTMPMVIKKACEKAAIQPDELRFIFPHQANLRILETAAKNLKIPFDRIYVNIQEHGNMSSACIPICLSEAFSKGKLNAGDKICLVGFGAGLTYGAIVMEL